MAGGWRVRGRVKLITAKLQSIPASAHYQTDIVVMLFDHLQTQRLLVVSVLVILNY